MMSMSYQSSKPCTVLVKEKPDSHQLDCSPSIQSSTNRPNNESPAEQQDGISSGTNIVGGKRDKRQVLNVVVDGDGHEDVVESVEKRILVNISIGMDKGLGSSKQEVYQLRVAVPLKHEVKTKDFYTYQVHGSDDDENLKLVDDNFEFNENNTESTSNFNKVMANGEFDEFNETNDGSGFFDFIPLSTQGSNSSPYKTN